MVITAAEGTAEVVVADVVAVVAEGAAVEPEKAYKHYRLTILCISNPVALARNRYASPCLLPHKDVKGYFCRGTARILSAAASCKNEL